MVLHLVFEIIRVGASVAKASLKELEELQDLELSTLSQSTGSRVYVEGKSYKGSYLAGVGPDGFGSLVFQNGNKYQGQFSRGFLEGFGVYTWASGQIYEGHYSQSKRSGRGTLISPQSVILYTGDWADDKRNGKGVSFYSVTGNVSYQGQWQNDQRHGHGVWFFQSGAKCFEGLFVDNTRVKGISFSDNLDLCYWYEGGFKDNLYSGYGTQHTVHGDYKGQFLNNKRNGQGTFTYSKDDAYHRLSYEGEWLEGKKHGHGKESSIKGDVFEGEFVEGKKSGKGIYKYANRVILESTWKENLAHGLSKLTLADGNLMEGSYVEGKKEGTWVYISTKTGTRTPIIYKNDEKVVTKNS